MQNLPRLRIRSGAVLLCIIGVILAGMSKAQPISAQASCPLAHCLWAPFVSTFSPVQIVDQTWYPQGNEVEIVGMLETTTQQPVYDVLLQARIFDITGTLLQTIVITPTFDATLPGQSNPFEQNISVCCQPRRTEISLLSWQPSSARTYIALPVTLLEWGSEHFKVSVQNDQHTTIYHVIIQVNEGGTSYIQRLDALAPGKIAKYEQEAFDPFGFSFFSWAQATLQP